MSRRSETLRDQRLELYAAQHELCETCGLPIALAEAELAHKIPEALWAFARWGRRVIDHPLNKAMTHRGYCNDQQNIQNRPLDCEVLVSRIREAIEHERL